MKITLYELLGLVKDGKQPNKIKYKGQEYTFIKDNEVTDYSFKDDNEIYGWLSTSIGNEYISDMFTNTVEIIKEPKKIEKLPKNITDNACATRDQKTIANKINELIDEINNLKEKKEEQED